MQDLDHPADGHVRRAEREREQEGDHQARSQPAQHQRLARRVRRELCSTREERSMAEEKWRERS